MTERTSKGSNAVGLIPRDSINIPDNILQQGIRDYSQKDQDDLLWLFGWAGSQGYGRDKLCELLVTDWTTISRIVQGKYGASLKNFIKNVRLLREQAARSINSGFIETIVTKKIFDTLDYALAGDLDGGKIVLITGATRRSKSHSVKEWCRRNNHGRSVYIDCPESGGLRSLMHELSSSCRIKARNTDDRREQLIQSFNRRRILVIDEATRLLPNSRRQGTPTQLEFIRRLHDVRHCAIALVATTLLAEEIERGNLRDYLEQLLGRIVEPLMIPQKVYKSECRDIVSSFRKNPPDDLVTLAHKIANEPGKLGVLFELIRQAAKLAERKKIAMKAAHLLAAYQRRKKRVSWPTEDK